MLGTNFDPFNQRPRQSYAPSPRPRAPLDEKLAAKMQRKQVMRFLFNPEVGQSFEGLKETHGLFLRLVANVFLQTGLVDAAYPGFRDASALTLPSLLRYAYAQLEFTREGLPRVLLFGAFVGSLVAVVLAMIVFVFSVLHAAPTAAPGPHAAGVPVRH